MKSSITFESDFQRKLNLESIETKLSRLNADLTKSYASIRLIEHVPGEPDRIIPRTVTFQSYTAQKIVHSIISAGEEALQGSKGFIFEIKIWF